MDFCVLFVGCLLGAVQASGGVVCVLERGFWMPLVCGYFGEPIQPVH